VLPKRRRACGHLQNLQEDCAEVGLVLCRKGSSAQSGKGKIIDSSIFFTVVGYSQLTLVSILRLLQIVWPDRWDQVYTVTIDGVHTRINEPKHPSLSKNPKYYSHKFKEAALDYELAIAIFENKLVWIKGPRPAGEHDITVFRKKLKSKIPRGKRAVGDNGYKGEKAIISTPNRQDAPEVRKFKSRARLRHETFNSRIKNFKCLDVRFRHGIKKHKIVFEAVCVICQYQLENGSPLFDV
jgi:hypothetical protein